MRSEIMLSEYQKGDILLALSFNGSCLSNQGTLSVTGNLSWDVVMPGK